MGTHSMSCETNHPTYQDHSDLTRTFLECGYINTAAPVSEALIADLLGAIEAQAVAAPEQGKDL